MDFVDRAYSQPHKLYDSMTPAARWTVGVSAVVVLAGLCYLGTRRGAPPDADLMRGASVTPAQLPAMEAALAKAELTDYEIRGTSIFVPRGREAAYMAALADADALPPNFGDILTKAVNAGGPFLGNRDREQRIKIAKQAELSLIIRSFNGIENAYVLYDEDRKSGIRREKLITATVGVKPAGDARLDEARVSAIRHLVAGAIAGLKPEDVTVSDLNGGIWHENLKESVKTEQHAAQSPPPTSGTEHASNPGNANPLNDICQNDRPATDLAGESRWFSQPWLAIGLIGLALAGLLALRSIVRGAPAGGRRSLASGSADDEADTAGKRSSVVPRPHWRLRRDAADRSSREELSRLVDEDPETAANILRNWIGQAS